MAEIRHADLLYSGPNFNAESFFKENGGKLDENEFLNYLITWIKDFLGIEGDHDNLRLAEGVHTCSQNLFASLKPAQVDLAKKNLQALKGLLESKSYSGDREKITHWIDEAIKSCKSAEVPEPSPNQGVNQGIIEYLELEFGKEITQKALGNTQSILDFQTSRNNCIVIYNVTLANKLKDKYGEEVSDAVLPKNPIDPLDEEELIEDCKNYIQKENQVVKAQFKSEDWEGAIVAYKAGLLDRISPNSPISSRRMVVDGQMEKVSTSECLYDRELMNQVRKSYPNRAVALLLKHPLTKSQLVKDLGDAGIKDLKQNIHTDLKGKSAGEIVNYIRGNFSKVAGNTILIKVLRGAGINEKQISDVEVGGIISANNLRSVLKGYASLAQNLLDAIDQVIDSAEENAKESLIA